MAPSIDFWLNGTVDGDGSERGYILGFVHE